MPAAQDARTAEVLQTAPSGFALERKYTIYAAPEGLCRRNGWGKDPDLTIPGANYMY